MNCLEFRRTLGADPRAGGPMVAAHAATCEACERFRRQAKGRDDDLRAVLEVDVPAGLADRVLYAKAKDAPAWHWRAAGLAAGLLMAVGIAALAVSPAPSAAEIVSHVEAERLSAGPVDPDAASRLERRAASFGGIVDGLTALRVNLCIVGGRPVLHLVVAGENGPVDVMIVPGSRVLSRAAVKVDGIEGWIAPGRNAGLAVLGPVGAGPAGRDVDRIMAAVRWSPVPGSGFGAALANLGYWTKFAWFAAGG